jgi:hypothetical protein
MDIFSTYLIYFIASASAITLVAILLFKSSAIVLNEIVSDNKLCRAINRMTRIIFILSAFGFSLFNFEIRDEFVRDPKTGKHLAKSYSETSELIGLLSEKSGDLLFVLAILSFLYLFSLLLFRSSRKASKDSGFKLPSDLTIKS